MPSAKMWADEFERKIKEYGFSDDEIERYTNADRDTMHTAIERAGRKIIRNTKISRRTLLVCFYAGHGMTVKNSTSALLNSSQREGRGSNQYELEAWLRGCVKSAGAYVIGLLACDRAPMPEELEEKMVTEWVGGYKASRGGTEETIKETGQGIIIHATPDG